MIRAAGIINVTSSHKPQSMEIFLGRAILFRMVITKMMAYANYVCSAFISSACDYSCTQHHTYICSAKPQPVGNTWSHIFLFFINILFQMKRNLQRRADNMHKLANHNLLSMQTHPHSNFIVGVSSFACWNCGHWIDHINF